MMKCFKNIERGYRSPGIIIIIVIIILMIIILTDQLQCKKHIDKNHYLVLSQVSNKGANYR